MNQFLKFLLQNGLNAKDLQEELSFRELSMDECRNSGLDSNDSILSNYSTSFLKDALQILIEGSYNIDKLAKEQEVELQEI